MEKQKLQERQQQILDLVKQFCAVKLNDEYFKLAERLTAKLGRRETFLMQQDKLRFGLRRLFTPWEQSISCLTKHQNHMFQLTT